MTESELYSKLVSISEISDFHLELKQVHSKTYWGRYYPDRKLIRLYALDENGEQYSNEDLLREGLHELTHHIQYHHLPFWRREKGVMHDDGFWYIFKDMFRNYFGKELEEVT